ncbi:hypothetical protein AB0C74_26625 [Spirillospora sp. NPDC048832]
MRDHSLENPGNVDIVQGGKNDPLPGTRPEWRWAAPYLSDRTGRPTVFTRRPLTQPEVAFGLRSCLSAETLERLKALMAEEDEKYEMYARRQRGRTGVQDE